MDHCAGDSASGAELFEQPLFSPRAATKIEDGHATGAEHEGREFLGFAKPSGAQGLERRDQDLLRQVQCSLLFAQVTQAVKPNARRHAAAKFGLCFAIVSQADLPHQVGVSNLYFHAQRVHTFYV